MAFMFDLELANEQLAQVEEACERIIRRMSEIHQPADFTASEQSAVILDATAMILIAIGETLKKMDKHFPAEMFDRHPEVDWKRAKGMRDILAHEYFSLDVEKVFGAAKHRVPQLLSVVRSLRAELNQEKLNGHP